MMPSKYLAAFALWCALSTLAMAEPPLLIDPISQGEKLLEKGDALADQGKPSEAVLEYKNGLEKILPEMRKLPLKKEIARDVTAREKLKEVVLGELEKEMTPEEFRASEAGLKALGFVPKDLDLKSVLVEVYAAEIAAFYDTRTDTMHLIEETEGIGGRKPTFLERLMGRSEGFDKDENKAVIAHELTHALTDQHFDLQALQDAINEDDDRDLALAALIEGEATLTMTAVQMDDLKGEVVIHLPAKDLERGLSLMTPFLSLLTGAHTRNAPAVIRESLLFPYLRGLVFCTYLSNKGGWESINKAYGKLPISTEQILHPEKYEDEPDVPRDFDLAGLETPSEWKALGRNVVGEMQASILLRRQQGRTAAEGWDGDRYIVYEGPEGRLGLVWRSVWDTEEDAREFARSYARFQTSKLTQAEAAPEEMPDKLERTCDGMVYLIERKGCDVVIVEGFPGEVTGKLAAQAFEAPCSEKTQLAPVIQAQSEAQPPLPGRLP